MKIHFSFFICLLCVSMLFCSCAIQNQNQNHLQDQTEQLAEDLDQMTQQFEKVIDKAEYGSAEEQNISGILEELAVLQKENEEFNEEFKTLISSLQELLDLQTSKDRKNVLETFLIIIAFLVLIVIGCVFVYVAQPSKKKRLPEHEKGHAGLKMQDQQSRIQRRPMGKPKYDEQEFLSGYDQFMPSTKSFDTSWRRSMSADMKTAIGAVQPDIIINDLDDVNFDGKSRRDEKRQPDKREAWKDAWKSIEESYKKGISDFSGWKWLEMDADVYDSVQYMMNYNINKSTQAYRLIPPTREKQYYQYVMINDRFLFPNFYDSAATRPDERLQNVLQTAEQVCMTAVFDLWDRNKNDLTLVQCKNRGLLSIYPAMVAEEASGKYYILQKGHIYFE